MRATPPFDPLPEPDDVFWRTGRCGEVCARRGSCCMASSPKCCAVLKRADPCRPGRTGVELCVLALVTVHEQHSLRSVLWGYSQHIRWILQAPTSQHLLAAPSPTARDGGHRLPMKGVQRCSCDNCSMYQHGRNSVPKTKQRAALSADRHVKSYTLTELFAELLYAQSQRMCQDVRTA